MTRKVSESNSDEPGTGDSRQSSLRLVRSSLATGTAAHDGTAGGWAKFSAEILGCRTDRVSRTEYLVEGQTLYLGHSG
jgi:hypothetical protein